ncbi:MAG: molybdopterin oxidoreductase [Gammaproteobacteria bacterium]|nr:MAG: molybdopterin oxidoreductase [Gammaproteobacteria bacterium]RKZ44194.1 MAG: molybdopterin oxidoreductase [Gammaproteobacteria bacterium]RKZ76935.1 MAG: molybdopterin oxidoreductase [Gammaproteobacteria bacterium]
MKKVNFCVIEGKSAGFYGGIVISTLMILLGLFAAYNMEHHGHIITGMNNQIVWGMPHIFAIFLILAASGVLNVASISSVFRKVFYHPLARLSALLAITLLLGGLSVLVLDLGRPDRIVVAMTSYNFKSIFAWNIVLYNGFLVVCAIYLWFMMERRMQRYYPTVGLIAFIWRLILTTGTGSIFGFLVAREAYHTAVMAPLFIALSLALGLAVFLIVLFIDDCSEKQCSLGEGVLHRPKTLLGVFIGAVFYFVLVYHISHLYFTGRHGVEYFILAGSGIYTVLFWGGYFFLGTILPLLLLYHERFSHSHVSIVAASFLTLLGGFALLYVIIIGGQAYPLEIFPGMEVISSGFFDQAKIHSYIPSGWEIMLGMSGIGISALLTVLALRILPFMPSSLADSEIEEAFRC